MRATANSRVHERADANLTRAASDWREISAGDGVRFPGGMQTGSAGELPKSRGE